MRNCVFFVCKTGEPVTRASLVTRTGPACGFHGPTLVQSLGFPWFITVTWRMRRIGSSEHVAPYQYRPQPMLPYAPCGSHRWGARCGPCRGTGAVPGIGAVWPHHHCVVPCSGGAGWVTGPACSSLTHRPDPGDRCSRSGSVFGGQERIGFGKSRNFEMIWG